MKRHFFIKKTNTIFKDSPVNTGFNPILTLSYGKEVSRILFQFDTDEIKREIEAGKLSGQENLKYVLKLKNCSSLTKDEMDRRTRNLGCSPCERASSFDIVVFRLPFPFDQGRGSSLCYDMWYDTKSTFKTDGSNWFQYKNNYTWKRDENTYMGIDGLDDGVYNVDYIEEQLENFRKHRESIIVGEQHFDYGFEDLEIDLTKEINYILNGYNDNYGFGIAFSPEFEKIVGDKIEIVSFFSDRTNTFFHPVLEISDSFKINDSRIGFNPKKDNELYLFCYGEDGLMDLDKLPSCSIDEQEFETRHYGTGTYCAVIPSGSITGEDNEIKYDIWSNVFLKEEELDPVEQSFMIMPKENAVSFGGPKKDSVSVVPFISGIYENEIIDRNQEIEISVDFIKEFSSGEKVFPSKAEMRIYILEGKNEITVFDYDLLNKRMDSFSDIIHTKDFIPGEYIIDIKATINGATKTFKGVKTFKIKNDVTKQFN